MKTRLAIDIGKRRAASLYRAFVEDTLAWVSEFSCSEKRVYFAPRDAPRANIRELARGLDLKGFRFFPQAEGDLGARLLHAFQAAQRNGARRIVALGTDCPLLGPKALKEAFRLLERKDLVLGPAVDGGYYLLGLKRCESTLFDGIPWSTAAVFEATREKARRARLSVATLAPLRDVDTLDDLRFLLKKLGQAHNRVGQERQIARQLALRRTLEQIAPCHLGAPKRSRGSPRDGR